ncbi:uncharacterized protein LOC105258217, partial [Camponotus floridanus]
MEVHPGGAEEIRLPGVPPGDRSGLPERPVAVVYGQRWGRQDKGGRVRCPAGVGVGADPDIAYDSVLAVALPRGCRVVCYADDTIVLAEGDDWGEAAATASLAVACVARAIRALGLRVAPQKSEAIVWHDGSRGRPPPMVVTVEDTTVRVGSSLKYLGLILDSRWRFEEHVSRLVPRLTQTAMALGRLLPNLGGPDGRVRRLYAWTVHAMALYGAPVWAEQLGASARLRDMLHRVQRVLALRAVRAYRTVAFEAALALAGIPPAELLASALAGQYRRMRELREREGVLALPARTREMVRRRFRRTLALEWQTRLQEYQQTAGARVVGALAPCLSVWTDRRWGGLSYHTTQVLTGHGCFGSYLCRIGKEATRRCHHCPVEEDTAQHTLEECSAWDVLRRDLRGVLGREDLSLSSLVEAMLESEGNWRAVTTFCGAVLRIKEEAERERRAEGPYRVRLGAPR